MSTITTTDHAACDDPKVEDGFRQLLHTPPDKRPCAAVPFLRQRGLDNRQSLRRAASLSPAHGEGLVMEEHPPEKERATRENAAALEKLGSYTDTLAEKTADRQARWRSRNPEKVWCHVVLKSALRRGLVV